MSVVDSESSLHLEIACFSVDSALIAIKAGAHRVELCSGPPSSGGLTPSMNDLKCVKDAAGSIPVHVMIRPRSGDFSCSPNELEAMRSSINELSDLADGFVFGTLTSDHQVDLQACKTLLAAAGGKPCVFHRAVDETANYMAALGVIQDLGFMGILTSGTKATAEEGFQKIWGATKFFGDELQIIVGGGVRASNIASLAGGTGARWFHSAATRSGSTTADAEEIASIFEILRPRHEP